MVTLRGMDTKKLLIAARRLYTVTAVWERQLAEQPQPSAQTVLHHRELRIARAQLWPLLESHG